MMFLNFMLLMALYIILLVHIPRRKMVLLKKHRYILGEQISSFARRTGWSFACDGPSIKADERPDAGERRQKKLNENTFCGPHQKCIYFIFSLLTSSRPSDLMDDPSHTKELIQVHFLDVAQILIVQMNVPKYLWTDVVLCVCHLINIMPAYVLHGKILFSCLSLTKPHSL